MNDVLREQIQLNTKEVVVNVDNDHMKASISRSTQPNSAKVTDAASIPKTGV